MAYTFTRTGAQIEEIHNTVEDPKGNTQFSDDIRTIAGEYRGLWPDTGGSANKGDTYQTQVGGTPTGNYYTALQNTSVDPVGDNVNWREVVSNQSLGVVTNYQADSVADMIAGVPIGSHAVGINNMQVWTTSGYYTATDGGGMSYRIINGNSGDGYGSFNIGSYTAVPIPKSVMSYTAFGVSASSQNTSDRLQAFLNFCGANGVYKATDSGAGITIKISKGIALSSKHNSVYIDMPNDTLKDDETVSKAALIGVYNGDGLNTSEFADGGSVGDVDLNIGVLNLDGGIDGKALIDNRMDDPIITSTAIAESQYTLLLSDVLDIDTARNLFLVDFADNFDPLTSTTRVKVWSINGENSKGTCAAMEMAAIDIEIGSITAKNCVSHPFSPSHVTSRAATFKRGNVDVGSVTAENCASVYDMTYVDKLDTTRAGNVTINRVFGRDIRLRSKIHGSFSNVEIQYQESIPKLAGVTKRAYPEFNVLQECDTVTVGTLISNFPTLDDGGSTSITVDSSVISDTKVNIEHLQAKLVGNSRLGFLGSADFHIGNINCKSSSNQMFSANGNVKIGNIKKEVYGSPAASSAGLLSGNPATTSYSVGAIDIEPLNMSYLISDCSAYIGDLTLNGGVIEALCVHNFTSAEVRPSVYVNNIEHKNSNVIEALARTAGTQENSFVYISVGNLLTTGGVTSIFRGGSRGYYYEKVRDLNSITFSYYNSVSGAEGTGAVMPVTI